MVALNNHPSFYGQPSAMHIPSMQSRWDMTNQTMMHHLTAQRLAMQRQMATGQAQLMSMQKKSTGYGS
jgi:hypothetical protein